MSRAPKLTPEKAMAVPRGTDPSSPMDEANAEYEAAVRIPKLFPETPTGKLFEHVMTVFGDSPALECVRILMDNSYNDLTIKQVAVLTGLTPVYIRRRTQEGSFSKDYDERGRVIIPAVEVEAYLRKKATKAGRAYVIRLTPKELSLFRSTFPDKALAPRYDPIAAKAYRLRKAANSANRGTTQGRLRLS